MARNRLDGTSLADVAEKVRLDKWLWAARLFKTRALAQEAVDGGRVHYNGERVNGGKLQLTTIPDAVGSGQRTNPVVTPSGSMTFLYRAPRYFQDSVPPCSSARIIPVRLSISYVHNSPRSSG